MQVVNDHTTLPANLRHLDRRCIRCYPMQDSPQSLSENWEGSCGAGFWGWPRRRDRSIPARAVTVELTQANAKRPRRPEGFRGQGHLAALLLSQRPLRVSSLVAPCQLALPTKTGPLPIFRQALRKRFASGQPCDSTAGLPVASSVGSTPHGAPLAIRTAWHRADGRGDGRPIASP